MPIELTSEEIVTQILSSNEILRPRKGNFYISNKNTLGDFLKNLPEEEIVEETAVEKDTKYTFITKEWHI